jgi:hypothetical protein
MFQASTDMVDQEMMKFPLFCDGASSGHDGISFVSVMMRFPLLLPSNYV